MTDKKLYSHIIVDVGGGEFPVAENNPIKSEETE